MIRINTTVGELSLGNSNQIVAGVLTIAGNGCHVASYEGLRMSLSRLLNVKGSEGGVLSLQMSNMSIYNFGTSTIEGGALKLQNIINGSLTDVYFGSNIGTIW